MSPTPQAATETIDLLVQEFNEAYREMTGDLTIRTTVVEQRIRQNPLIRP